MESVMLTFLIVAGFLSGFIDSVVGGGGLISLPALLLTGIPLPLALGTNKFASSFSSLTSTLNFIKNKRIDIPLAKKLFLFSFIGSMIGAYTVTQISPDALRPVVAVLLILITVYTLLKKNWGSQERSLRKNYLRIAIPFTLFIGFYDGFLGPGTGSFFVFLFLYIGFDFVKAAGNSRIMNFGSNIAALILFAFSGHVNYYYGIIMALAMIVGSYLGSTMAIRNGQKYIKPLFVVVSFSLIIKVSVDWLLK
jgi:uncharacterized protein